MPEGEYLIYSRAMIFALVSLVAVLSQASSFSNFEEYAQAILARAPQGWSIAEKRVNVVPEGFYNKDTTGELYIFCGPNKVTWNWKDRAGNWHREPLAHESLEIWLFPGDYRPGIRTYLSLKGPVLPTLVYDSERVRVYVMPSHRLIVTDDEFNKSIRKATEVYWDDSGGKHTISWINWKSEIATALQSAERLK
jgi:hypothetical protein